MRGSTESDVKVPGGAKDIFVTSLTFSKFYLRHQIPADRRMMLGYAMQCSVIASTTESLQDTLLFMSPKRQCYAPTTTQIHHNALDSIPLDFLG
jgi:hypothetical protein